MQEAKRNFTNDFRHLLKSYMEVMDNVEVASAKEIEASLRERLDTESLAVAREAAAHEEGTERAGAEPSSLEREEAELAELQREVVGAEEHQVAAEDPGSTQRLEPEAQEPGPSTEAQPAAAQGSAGEETAYSQPAPAEEPEREESSLAEESRSQGFFERDQGSSPEHDRGDRRIFRASRFLRRRE